MRQESALYGRARCVPPPCRFRFIGLIERFVWARTMRRLRLTDTLRGIPPAALLKSVLLVLPAAENPPFRRKAGVRRGFAAFCTCGSLCSFPRGVPPAPRRKPHPSCGLREQRPHPRSAAARRTGVGALPQRGLPAPATPERSAARVPAKRKRRTLYGSARLWIYGAGTRALTS